MRLGSDSVQKIMITLKNKEMVLKTLAFTDAYLLGVEGFSVNMDSSFSLEEVKEIVSLLKKENKEVFIHLNKNMFSHDLKPLEELLLAIEELQVDGIGFYDISIPSIIKRRGLKTPLVWSQEHFTTNYETMNYWYENNVVYTQLSCEITKEEVNEIKEHTQMKLIAQVFGYVPIFYSKRPLLTNYKKTFSIKGEEGKYAIEKEGKYYPIREEGASFEAFDATILNAYLDMETLKVDYLLLHSFKIEENQFIEVLQCYKERKKARLEELYPFYSGFFEKKTVYRVRDL